MFCARGIASRAPTARYRGSSTNSGFSLIEVLFGVLLSVAIAVLSLPTIEGLASQAENSGNSQIPIPANGTSANDDFIVDRAEPADMTAEAGIDAGVGEVRDMRAGNGQARPLQGGTGQ